MENDEHIVRYTAEELDALIAVGKFKTDWARVDALTDEEIEASIDVEDEGIPDPDSRRTSTIWHEQQVSMMLDDAIVEWFRAAVADTGIGYKTRIAEVLREYVAAQEAAAAGERDPDGAATPVDPALLSHHAG